MAYKCNVKVGGSYREQTFQSLTALERALGPIYEDERFELRHYGDTRIASGLGYVTVINTRHERYKRSR